MHLLIESKTYKIGFQQSCLFNIVNHDSSNNFSSVIILYVVFFSGGIQFCFSDDNGYDIQQQVNLSLFFLVMSFIVVMGSSFLLSYLQNRRAPTPSYWIDSNGWNYIYSPFSRSCFFKYSHPENWVETFSLKQALEGTKPIVVFGKREQSLGSEKDINILPEDGLFFHYIEHFYPDDESIPLETRIFRTITTDSTEFISKKQKEIELNGDEFTQYDLETSKSITKQFYCQKKGKHILCSFWSTDKQLFKQKESLMDSIAGTFYLSSF